MGTISKAGSDAEGAVGQFSSALKANRLEMNQSRVGMLEFQHVARGMSDQFATSGLSTQLFTSHIGELSEAVVLSGSAFGKLGLFLQGPWGIALTIAGTAIATLIASHRKEGDTLDDTYAKLVKHKEQTELSAQAEDIWSHSLDGLIDRTKALNDELDKRVETQTTLNRITMQSAQEQFAAAVAAQEKLEADPKATADQLAKASKEVTATSLALHSAEVSASEEAGKEIASATEAAKAWADLERSRIQAISGEHPELAEKPIGDQIEASVNRVSAAIQAAASAGLSFDPTAKAVSALNEQLLNGSINATTFEQRMNALAQSLTASTAAFKNQDKAIEDFKKSVIGAEGTGQNQLGSSAAGFGQFMPSTFESYFKQLYPSQAASMTNAQIDALRNNRQIATAVIDKATDDYVTVLKSAGQQITAASLYTVHVLGAGDARKLFNAAPNTPTSSFLSAAVLRGNPFLQGTAASARAALARRIGDSSGSVSSGAAALIQAQEEAAKKAAEQEAAFTQEMGGLNLELLKARQGQVKDELAQLDIQEDEVRAEQQKRDNTYKSAVATGKLTQAQADQLTALAATVAAEKLKALETEKSLEIIKRQDQAAEQSSQFAQDNLKAQEQAATSQQQRRELDLQILDILYNEKLAHLERLKLIAEGNGQLDQANQIQAQIDQLPNQKSADRAGAIRGTMDPLEAFLQAIPHDAQKVTEALQSVAVNGFDNLASSIAGVVTGTQTLGSAFASLAQQVVGDLVQMIAKMLIFRALSGLLGLGGIPSPDLGANAQVDLGFLAPLLPATPDLSSLIDIPKLAGGGLGVIGGTPGDTNLLSLNGRGIAWVSKGEGLAIVPNNASAASPFASAMKGMIVVQVEANDYFDARVAAISGPIAAQAGTNGAIGGAALARNNLARRQLHQLGSRG